MKQHPYKKHLKKDAKLAAILPAKTHELLVRKNIALQLIFSIMGQQLSTQVAEIIKNRFIALFNGKTLSLQKILDTPFENLRSIGLSNAKTTYVKNTATFFLENKLTDKKLQGMTNDELMELLTQIKGVGKWTVEMLLMFSLGREDIFSNGDLGIQQAMIKCYGLKTTDKKKMIAQMEKIALAWSPYRTYACLHLWEWKDNKK